MTEPLAMPTESMAKPIVEAVAIKESDLHQEIVRLENAEKQKQAKIAAEQQALQKQKNAAIQARKREEQQLAKLKQEQEKLKQAEAKKQKERIAQEKLAKEQRAKEEATLAQLKIEKEKLEQEKSKIEEAKRKAEAEQKRQAEQARLEEEKQAKLRATKRLQEKTQQHIHLVMQKVTQNWRKPMGMETQLKSLLSVRLSPSGEVLEAIVKETSGNMEFDRSAELAIRKASPLPMPEDQEILKHFLKFSFYFEQGAA